jgi:glycosyl hydrolase family 16
VRHAEDVTAGRFEEHFDQPTLDRDVWLPHYLPAWSSRADTAASYQLRDSCLVLDIPPEQALWCAPDHQPALRVSGVQSGNFSGPVGSVVGQQPYRDGLTVREQQDPFWGWTPDGGYLELNARVVLSPRSMASCWLVGLEDRPERCAEICVFEVFGNAIRPGTSASIGAGLHAFRDPSVPEDFATTELPIDVADFHSYGVDWRTEQAIFYVDGEEVRRCPRPPSYPMQVMLAVFDFPEGAEEGTAHHVPQLVVDRIGSYPSPASTPG